MVGENIPKFSGIIFLRTAEMGSSLLFAMETKNLLHEIKLKDYIEFIQSRVRTHTDQEE